MRSLLLAAVERDNEWETEDCESSEELGPDPGTTPHSDPHPDRQPIAQVKSRMDADLHDRLCAISASEERSLSQMIRYALRRYADTMSQTRTA